MTASFGNVLLVFSRIGADGALQKPLDSANLREAEQFLAEADEATLRQFLSDATRWGQG